MKRIILLVTSTVCLAILVTLFVSPGGAKEKPKHEPSPTAYNPYPPGVLPPDVDAEILRVRSEVRGIEPSRVSRQPFKAPGRGQINYWASS